jgi:thioredoxin-like negative regulator of GroEL
MKLKTILLPVLLIGLVAALSGCASKDEQASVIDILTAEPEVAMEESHEEAPVVALASKSAAEFVDFDQAAYDAALANNEPFALFFHAEWCGTCRGLEKSIEDGLAAFPEGTKIFQVDYDNETALKQQYGIRMQSMIVIVDANGEAVETLAAPSNSKLIAAIENTL